MDAINELELRRLLKTKYAASELSHQVIRKILNPTLSWEEEKRALWHFLFATSRLRSLAQIFYKIISKKGRIPFDIFIELTVRAGGRPAAITLEALLKGLKKQKAAEEIISAKSWDRFDNRLPEMRAGLLKEKVGEQHKLRENMMEKFNFLLSQRMNEQAGRVLRRMQELYPGDQDLMRLKRDFDEQKARDVLSSHAARSMPIIDRTLTAPSSSDEAMLMSFLDSGEEAITRHREFAVDLAIGFWFMEDYDSALKIVAWAQPSITTDWLRAELLFAARRFLQALEQLNALEAKYIEDPESTFAVSYLRAQCLHALGQQASGLEIMQSIVRVRPNYRSAHALILQWTEGAGWE